MKASDILAKCHEVAGNPAGQRDKYLAQGKKIVLVAPVYTPEEIVYSFDCIPMGAWGADCELEEAKKYFPAFLCSIVQSALELGIRGAYRGASAIVIPSLCDSLKVMGENWKYAVPSIPFIPMTYPQNRMSEAAAAFTKAGYERVIRDLEKLLGRSFDEAKLAKSIEVYNRHNAAMREVASEMARHPEISAGERSDVFKSAFFMDKAEHTEWMYELLTALREQKPSASSKIPVYVTGILTDSPVLNGILDEAGLQIAADDVAAQSRQYRTDIPQDGNPLENLVQKFCRMDNCSVLFDPKKKRCHRIADEARALGARGVLLVLTKFCDPEEFDYPLIKKACDAAGLPITMFEVDRQMENYEQARTAVQAFREILES